MIKISPSILSADFTRLGEEIRAVEAAGADYIHVDVMDGHFVPNLTIGPVVVEGIRKAASKPLDVHLMISPVEIYIPAFAQAGAHLISVHCEATHHLDRTLNLIREQGCRAGVALNPATPISQVQDVLHLVDMVVLMSVNPGFGGQSFIPYVLQKVRAMRTLIQERGLTVDLEVDGGVKVNNIAEMAASGANVFVAGSAVFTQPDYQTVIGQLRGNAEAAWRAAP
ncbi:MAG: ribulose-phosphate 3-epimerase [Magnetococcales bacterium]|nr:ribulose-phosphate 3-epimerase [Magnetococcales bacterium]